MFILARTGTTSSRLRFNIGPDSEAELPVQIDCRTQFAASNQLAWEQEYLTNVQPQQPVPNSSPALEPVLTSPFDEEPTSDWYDSWSDYAAGDESVKGSVT